MSHQSQRNAAFAGQACHSRERYNRSTKGLIRPAVGIVLVLALFCWLGSTTNLNGAPAEKAATSDGGTVSGGPEGSGAADARGGSKAKKRDRLKATDVDQPEAGEVESKKKTRLPRYFSKLGLNESQRSEILKSKATFDEREARLKAELDDLQHERNAAMAELLTPEQRTALEKLQSAQTELASHKAELNATN